MITVPELSAEALGSYLSSDLDLRFGAEFEGRPAGGVRASVWSPGGQLLGVVERVLFSSTSRYPESAVAGHTGPPAEACANTLV